MPKRMRRLGSLIVSALLLEASLAQQVEPVDTQQANRRDVSNRFVTPKQSRRMLLNGLQISVIEQRQQPTVTISLLIKAGAEYDPINKAGLASLTAAMLRSGTRNRTAWQIAQMIEAIKASFEERVGWDGTTITATAPAEHFERLADVFSDVVASPTFPAYEFEKVKRQRLQELSRRSDDPEALSDDLFVQALFGKTAYGHPILGTVESVSSITLADVVNFYRKFYLPNDSFLIVVGSVDPETALKALSRRIGIWVKGDEVPATFLQPSPVQGIKISLIDKPELAEAHIRLGHLGIRRDNDEIFAVKVMSYMLGGGPSSRLAMELKAKLGLDAQIRSAFEARRMQGPFVISAKVPSEKAGQACVAIVEAMKDFISSGPTEKELEDAKAALISSFMSQLGSQQQLAEKILEMELYQLGIRYLDSYQDRVLRVTLEDVRRAAERYLDPHNLVIVVVGRAEEAKADLEKLGEVQVVRLKNLPCHGRAAANT